MPLHLGLTEAGMGNKGVVSSTAALSILLAEGIGDTIRVSLTPKPGASRAEEVDICQQILAGTGHAFIFAHSDSVPRLRTHHEHGVSGAGSGNRAAFSCAKKSLER